VKWRNQMDDNKEYYKTAMGMLELANTPLHGNIAMRASTEDLLTNPKMINHLKNDKKSLWAFVAGPRRDIAKLILSLACGVKVGKGDLKGEGRLERGE